MQGMAKETYQERKVREAKQARAVDPEKSTPAESKTAPIESSEPSGPKGAPFVQRGIDAPSPDRGSYPLTPDGLIDWSTLKGKNKERLLAALKNDPEVARLAGREVSKEEIFAFTEKDAQEILEFLSEGNAFAVHFVFKKKGLAIDPDILGQAFQVPADSRLTERGARLMNRYSNEFVRKHADLFMFFSGYMKMVKAQAQAAVIMQLQRNASRTVEAQPQAAKPNGAEARQ